LARAKQASLLGQVGSDWMEYGACRRFGAALFSPKDPRELRQDQLGWQQREIEVAKAICRMCPVNRHCLSRALSRKEPYGIWGGLTGPERAKITEPDSYQLVHSPAANYELGYASIEGMKRLMIEKGRVPREREVVEEARRGRMPGRKTIRRIFGTWGVFKRVVALSLLADRCAEKGSVLEVSEIRAANQVQLSFHPNTLHSMFGSVARAQKLSGALKVKGCPNLTDTQLEEDFVRLCEEARRVLSPGQLDKAGRIGLCASRQTYYRHFGGYDGVVEAARKALEQLGLLEPRSGK
jgi:hypothetical protein